MKYHSGCSGAPPLQSTLQPKWFAPHSAYTMAKYGMSLCVLGMAEEFRAEGIAVNALGHAHPDVA